MRQTALCCLAALAMACGDDASDKAWNPDHDAGTDSDGCVAGSAIGELSIDIKLDDVAARVEVWRGDEQVGDTITASKRVTLPAGEYAVSAHRVRESGELVGPAYQSALGAPVTVCIEAGKTRDLPIAYTREPGSAKLWLTQSNGDGAQVMAFDAAQLAERGEKTPSVSLSPKLDNAGPIRVDAHGRLWVASNTGKLAGYAAARLGETTTGAPDILLQGAALCEDVVPCGARALAFDASGNLWVATAHRVQKLSAASIERSGSPAAAVTITSPDFASPTALAFDADGNLWVADGGGGVAKIDAGRLDDDLDDAAADSVIFARQPGPVELGLGDPEGLAFDPEGNLWVGYFGGNDLVRYKPSELAAGASEDDPLVPSTHVKIGTEALVTDLALDESGNLWLPGGAGSLYVIAKAQLSADDPELQRLHSGEIGSVEKLTLNTVPGPLFIAP